MKALLSSCYICCLFLLSAHHIVAFSDTYYVNAIDGNDERNGLSEESAWKTISRVNSVDLEPADDVLFKRGGKYNDAAFDLDWSGKSEDKTVIGAYGSGAKPIFSFSGHAPLRSWKQHGSFKHVLIEDLDIRVSKGSGIEIGASAECSYGDITIRNVDIKGTEDASNGMLLKYIESYKISDCTIRGIPNSGIAVIGTSENPVKKGIIRDNTIYNIGSNDGICLHKNGNGDDIGADHLIVDNVLYNCEEQGLDITSGTNVKAIGNETYGNGDSGILVAHEASDVLIHRHYSHDEGYMGIIIGPSSNVKLTSSIIQNPAYHPLRINDAKNVQVYHNTIALGSDSSGSAIDIEGKSRHISIKNNIIASLVPGKPNRYMRFLSGNTPPNTDTTMSHNIWWRPDADAKFYDKKEGNMSFEKFKSVYDDQNGVGYVKDPLLKLSESGVLRPAKGSPAFDAGTRAGVNEDFNGNSIPQGQRPDVGAWEY